MLSIKTMPKNPETEEWGDRRAPSEHEYAAADFLYEQIKGCQDQRNKIVRLLATFIRDWNIDIEERDELTRTLHELYSKRAKWVRDYRKRKKETISKITCSGYLPPINEPCSICGAKIGERHKN